MRQSRLDRNRQRQARRRRRALFGVGLTLLLTAAALFAWRQWRLDWGEILGATRLPVFHELSMQGAEVPAVPSAPDLQASTPTAVAVPPDPVLDPYRSLLSAHSLTQAGDHAGALALLEAPPTDGYWLYLYHQIRATALRESGDLAGAREAAELAYSLSAGPEQTDAAVLVADLRQTVGDARGAADLLVELIPSSDLLFRGPERNRMIAQLNPVARRLEMSRSDDRERLMEMGDLLYRYGYTTEGAALFLRSDWPEPAGLELRYQRIRARAFLGETDAAIGDLVRLAKDAPPASAARFHYLRAAYLTARDQPEEARRAYEAAAAVGEGTYAGGMSVYRLAEPYLDADNVDRAEPLIARNAAAYGSTSGWQRGAWELFASAYATGQSGAVQRTLDLLEQVAPNDPQYLYWRYRVNREHGGNGAALLDRLLREHPTSYYALLAAETWPAEAATFAPVGGSGPASERLAALDRLAAAGAGVDPVYAGTDLALPLALWRADFREAACGVLRGLAEQAQGWELRYLLARWEGERGQHRESIRLMSRVSQEIGESPMPQAVLEGLYPRFYAGLVETAAAERSIDPYFVYAIIREESAFEPGAHSLADARGLMQIIPSTAEGLAKQVGLTGFAQTDLFHPAMAILLGSRYLSDLLEHFHGDTRLAAAAYNGGTGSVERWMEVTSPSDSGLFVERILYPETRNYVKITDQSYRVYRLLYGRGP